VRHESRRLGHRLHLTRHRRFFLGSHGHQRGKHPPALFHQGAAPQSALVHLGTAVQKVNLGRPPRQPPGELLAKVGTQRVLGEGDAAR
jgi:hypothetical protein